MVLCSKPPSHPAQVFPTRLTGLTEFLPCEAERPRATPTPSHGPAGTRRAHRLHATAGLTGTFCHARYGRPCYTGSCLPLGVLISPRSAPASGRHQPALSAPSIHTQVEGFQLPEPLASPAHRKELCRGQRQRWIPSSAGTDPNSSQGIPKHHLQSSTIRTCWRLDRHSWAPGPSGSNAFLAALSPELVQGALWTSWSPSQGILSLPRADTGAPNRPYLRMD